MSHKMDFISRSCAARLALGLFVLTGSIQTASAGWNEFWHGISVGFQRNNAWPDPFNEADALEVVRPFEQMKINGWKLHHTIGHEFFREGDGALLPNGAYRVEQLTANSPPSRRSIYILRGQTPEETQARVAAVRQTLNGLHLVGTMPQVVVTDLPAPTASGEWANRIGTEWFNSLPKPQLPTTSATGEQSAATPIGN